MIHTTNPSAPTAQTSCSEQNLLHRVLSRARSKGFPRTCRAVPWGYFDDTVGITGSEFRKRLPAKPNRVHHPTAPAADVGVLRPRFRSMANPFDRGSRIDISQGPARPDADRRPETLVGRPGARGRWASKAGTRSLDPPRN